MRLGRMSRALVNVVVIATTLVLRAGMAFAQSYPGGSETPPPTAVGGKTFFPNNQNPNPADTGTDILLFILLALLALAIGLYLHRISRKRADGHAD